MKVIRPKVLFILSTNYSGSHLLTHLISSHTEVCSVGELKNLNKFLTRPSSTHSVINDYSSNPLFSKLHTLDEKHWYGYLFDEIRKENNGVVCLVDNSKKADWARNFVKHPDLDVIFLHLIRDPRALVRRWEKTYTGQRQIKRQRVRLALDSPLYALKVLSKSQYDVYAYKWLMQNTQITNFLKKNNQQKNVISYLDLVSDTGETLKKIMEMIGLEYQESQLKFGNSKHIGTIKKDYLSLTEHSKIEMDLRWMDDLNPSVINSIIQNKDINRYLKLINHEWRKEGISAVSRLDR